MKKERKVKARKSEPISGEEVLKKITLFDRFT